jgi:hypothetical protein
MEYFEDLAFRSGGNVKGCLVGFDHAYGAIGLNGVSFLYFPFLDNAGFNSVTLSGHD